MNLTHECHLLLLAPCQIIKSHLEISPINYPKLSLSLALFFARYTRRVAGASSVFAFATIVNGMALSMAAPFNQFYLFFSSAEIDK
jgi:hypothetical protein